MASQVRKARFVLVSQIVTGGRSGHLVSSVTRNNQQWNPSLTSSISCEMRLFAFAREKDVVNEQSLKLTWMKAGRLLFAVQLSLQKKVSDYWACRNWQNAANLRIMIFVICSIHRQINLLNFWCEVRFKLKKTGEKFTAKIVFRHKATFLQFGNINRHNIRSLGSGSWDGVSETARDIRTFSVFVLFANTIWSGFSFLSQSLWMSLCSCTC